MRRLEPERRHSRLHRIRGLLTDVGKTIMVEFAGDAGNTIALFTTISAFVDIGQVTLAAPNLGGAITGSSGLLGRAP